MSEIIENMKKRIAVKENVKSKVDTKIVNTQRLIDNYTALVEKHGKASANYQAELERMDRVLQEALGIQAEIDKVLALIGSFSEDNPFIVRFGPDGQDNSKAIDEQSAKEKALLDRESDLSMKLRQCEILLNKIYYDR